MHPCDMKMSEVFECADVFTASAEYAARFQGAVGDYMLLVQEKAVAEMFRPYNASTVLDVGGGHGQLINLYRRNNMSITLHGSSSVCFDRLSQKQLEMVKCIISTPKKITSFRFTDMRAL